VLSCICHVLLSQSDDWIPCCSNNIQQLHTHIITTKIPEGKTLVNRGTELLLALDNICGNHLLLLDKIYIYLQAVHQAKARGVTTDNLQIVKDKINQSLVSTIVTVVEKENNLERKIKLNHVQTILLVT